MRRSFNLLLSLLLGCSAAHAFDAPINFKGTLVSPPQCTINEDNVIEVDFGKEIGVNKVDGNNYRQKIPYRLVCPPGSPSMRLAMTISGNSTIYDPAAVQTTIKDLGIKLYFNGIALALETELNIDPNSPPLFEAVPVKMVGSSLKAGAFEAVATLSVGYL